MRAHLLGSRLPATGKLRLCLDRTEWEVGQCPVNLLLVTVGQGDWHVPLDGELLDNRSGHSNAAHRIAVLQICLNLLGRERIGLVLGEREFVGPAWLQWLQDNKLNFVMRLPRPPHLPRPDGQVWAVADLGLAVGHVRRWPQAHVAGVGGMGWGKALAGGDFLFLFGNVGLAYMDPLYARRWTIEPCFQNLKGRGFNLENTGLRCLDKRRKLVARVRLAYALCLSVGQRANRGGTPIARKKYGYPAKSRSRHGLNILRQITRPNTPSNALARQVQALLDWLIRQVACYHMPVKIVG